LFVLERMGSVLKSALMFLRVARLAGGGGEPSHEPSPVLCSYFVYLGLGFQGKRRGPWLRPGGLSWQFNSHILPPDIPKSSIASLRRVLPLHITESSIISRQQDFKTTLQIKKAWTLWLYNTSLIRSTFGERYTIRVEPRIRLETLYGGLTQNLESPKTGGGVSEP
jgi:hypothetical protein